MPVQFLKLQELIPVSKRRKLRYQLESAVRSFLELIKIFQLMIPAAPALALQIKNKEQCAEAFGVSGNQVPFHRTLKQESKITDFAALQGAFTKVPERIALLLEDHPWLLLVLVDCELS